MSSYVFANEANRLPNKLAGVDTWKMFDFTTWTAGVAPTQNKILARELYSVLVVSLYAGAEAYFKQCHLIGYGTRSIHIKC